MLNATVFQVNFQGKKKSEEKFVILVETSARVAENRHRQILHDV